MRFCPTDWPIAKARITNASHPQNAFLRCLLLQRAIRAARLWDDGCESIWAPDEQTGCRPDRDRPFGPTKSLEPEGDPPREWGGRVSSVPASGMPPLDWTIPRADESA